MHHSDYRVHTTGFSCAPDARSPSARRKPPTYAAAVLHALAALGVLGAVLAVGTRVASFFM